MKTNYFKNLSRTCIILMMLLVGFSSCDRETAQKPQKMLKHIVLFNFNDDSSIEQITEVETAFVKLPSLIKEIKAFEWGTEINPKKEFTHCFVLSFESEEDLAAYIIHPAHKNFGEMLKGKTEAVSVVDYWVK